MNFELFIVEIFGFEIQHVVFNIFFNEHDQNEHLKRHLPATV